VTKIIDDVRLLLIVLFVDFTFTAEFPPSWGPLRGNPSEVALWLVRLIYHWVQVVNHATHLVRVQNGSLSYSRLKTFDIVCLKQALLLNPEPVQLPPRCRTVLRIVSTSSRSEELLLLNWSKAGLLFGFKALLTFVSIGSWNIVSVETLTRSHLRCPYKKWLQYLTHLFVFIVLISF